jgi:hypothetical protein
VVALSFTGPRKRFRETIAAHVGGHGRGLPCSMIVLLLFLQKQNLSPILNSSESRGLCCRSCFGPRTCGRGITNILKRFGALTQGFPFSPLQCRQGRTRMGGWVALRECVRCMQGLCCGFVFGDMDSCRDVHQYKVMKFLVFGIISSSHGLLSELQVMIPKVNHNAPVYHGICIVYPMLWSGGTAEFVYHPGLSIVSSVFMSVRFLWFRGLPPRGFLASRRGGANVTL